MADTGSPIAELAALLDRAEADHAAQGRSYRTELDDDALWRAGWNTWRTLGDLLPAVRALVDHQAAPPAAPAVRHLRSVHTRAA